MAQSLFWMIHEKNYCRIKFEYMELRCHRTIRLWIVMGTFTFIFLVMALLIVHSKTQAYIHGDDTWLKVGVYMGVAGTWAYVSFNSVRSSIHPPMGLAGDDPSYPPKMYFPSENPLRSHDHHSLRRGYQVYREICSSCHPMAKVKFRKLVGLTHTEEQAKQLAASLEVTDGPDKTGKYFKRPGKLDDYFPSPYANETEARYANDGSYPKDLTTMVRQDEKRRDYIFSLLTEPGKHWNNYFNGGWISMAEALSMDGLIDYEDGTPATKFQMAWDVTNFLSWTAHPEKEGTNKSYPLLLSVMGLSALAIGYWIRSAKMAAMKMELLYWKPKANLFRKP